MATYIKSVKNIKEGRFGLSLSVKYEDLVRELKEYVNPKGYVNLNINKNKAPDQYGNTHSCTLNTWTPDQNKTATQTPIIRKEELNDYNDDLPF